MMLGRTGCFFQSQPDPLKHLQVSVGQQGTRRLAACSTFSKFHILLVPQSLLHQAGQAGSHSRRKLDREESCQTFDTQALIGHSIICSAFYWPEQVTGPDQIQDRGIRLHLSMEKAAKTQCKWHGDREAIHWGHWCNKLHTPLRCFSSSVHNTLPQQSGSASSGHLATWSH